VSADYLQRVSYATPRGFGQKLSHFTEEAAHVGLSAPREFDLSWSILLPQGLLRHSILWIVLIQLIYRTLTFSI